MTAEAKKNSVEPFGSLRECLVDGDTEHLKRERRLRRRAMTLSLIIQAAVVAAVVLVPLYYTTDRIVMAGVVPLPPYFGSTQPIRHLQTTAGTTHDPRMKHGACFFCPQNPIKPITSLRDGNDTLNERIGDTSTTPGDPASDHSLTNIGTQDHSPRPPRTHEPIPAGRIRIATLEPAMLIHRLEPEYPVIARQLHLSGQVELHAVIATNGSIESLEAFSGNPIFFRSAMDAVRQWRYRATVLNGQPVEVDTIITVTYRLE